jgi:hypothetical protein
MGDELEVQIVNSPYMTLEVDLRSIVENIVSEEVTRYFDDFDWYDLFTDHSQTISDIANEDLDIHDQIHDVVNSMGFVESGDMGDEVNEAVRHLLQDFNRISRDNVCNTGQAFIEAVQKVANVSKADMRQELVNQFRNATIKLELDTAERE